MKKIKLKERLKCYTLLFLDWFALSTGLKKLWSLFLRYVFDWGQSFPVKKYKTVYELQKEVSRLAWRQDPHNGKWDYISSPETVSYKLENGRDAPKVKAEDCDGIHFFIAFCLARMKDVEDVQYLGTVYNSGAHATCVYTHLGKKYHWDYVIRPIDSYDDAPHEVADRYG